MLEAIDRIHQKPGISYLFQNTPSKYIVFQPQGVENLVFQFFWFEIPSILIEIPGFLFEMLGILKICDNRAQYNCVYVCLSLALIRPTSISILYVSLERPGFIESDQQIWAFFRGKIFEKQKLLISVKYKYQISVSK